MQLGIENIASYKNLLLNKRVGLITNFTGLTSKFESTISVLKSYTKVKKLFTPEHGLYGVAEAGEKVASYYDQNLGLQVISLFGEHKAPTVTELSDLDILVFDIQDIGVRYYTYIYTMYKCMQVAEKADLPFLVMDRPLPLGRTKPIGNLIHEDFYSFVGLLPLPNYYGLTIGELANWIKDTQIPQLNLIVCQMNNWNSRKTIKENKLPWVAPSPNLPTLDALRLYPGLCLIEGTNVSEGRGTVKPFEQFGAPWINGKQLATYLTDHTKQSNIFGFQPVWFKPLSSKYNGQVCQGVQVHIMNLNFNALQLGLEIIRALCVLYPQKFLMDIIADSGSDHNFIEYLAGSKLRNLDDIDNLLIKTDHANEQFMKTASEYYLY